MPKNGFMLLFQVDCIIVTLFSGQPQQRHSKASENSDHSGFGCSALASGHMDTEWTLVTSCEYSTLPLGKDQVLSLTHSCFCIVVYKTYQNMSVLNVTVNIDIKSLTGILWATLVTFMERKPLFLQWRNPTGCCGAVRPSDKGNQSGGGL